MSNRRTTSMLAAIALLAAATRPACAIAPPVLSDEALARAPIVVLAHWDPKGKIERHDDIDGNVMRNGEAHLELVVERSIVGDIEPGAHALLVRHYGGLTWDDEGRPSTGTSTDIPGDVDDVRVSNLWFLKSARSWDPKVTTEFLAPFGYHRSVQSPKFEAWYAALRPPAKDGAIAPFLASSDGPTALRALETVSGGIAPWPFRDGFDEWLRGKRDPNNVRRGLAHEVESALASRDAEVRRYAAALLDDLRGADAGPALRPLLKDADGGVRALAIALLAGRKDAPSLPRFAEAAAGAQHAWFGGAAVDRLLAWGAPEVVPAIAAFLETDETAGNASGGESGILAVKAREALRTLVGYAFPYDVGASIAAWADASKRGSPAERTARLRELLGDDAEPLTIRWPAQPTNNGSSVEVVNRSPRPVALARRPSHVVRRGDSGYMAWNPPAADKPDDFATIAPGGVLLVALGRTEGPSVEARSGSAPDTELVLTFGRHGASAGVRAWVGVLRLKIGN